MAGFLVNIDVADLRKAEAFYIAAFGLTAGRRLGSGIVELLGGPAVIYLIEKPAGSRAAGTIDARRDYARHWTPVHLDFVVPDLDAALARAADAGAVLEGRPAPADWGRLALMSDPFGNGFCLVEFSERGYDALVET